MPAGTFQGAVWAVGRQYYAAALDQGYVQIVHNSALVPASAITVEAWVKAQQSAGYVLCKNGSFTISLGGNVSAYFWLAGGNLTVNGNATFPLGKWTHLAVTYNSSTGVGCIYINGALDSTATYTGSSPTIAAPSYHPSFRLGQNDWSSVGSEFDGKIDSLRISNNARVFTPLYAANPGAPTPPGNLVPNGDFESGLMGWRLNGYGDMNLVWEATGGAASGQKCLHSLSTAITDYATAPGGGIPPFAISRPIPAHPGRQYTFSCRLKTAGSSNLYPRVETDQCGGPAGIATLDPTACNFSAIDGTRNPFYPTITTSWRTVTQTFTLPATFAAPSICIQFGYPSSGQQLFVNDVRLIAGDGPAILALKDKISVGPWSGLPVGNVFVYGATSPLTLNIVNTDTVAHAVSVQPTITDWQETPVSGIPSLGMVTVPANGVKTLTYNIDTTRRGAFRLGFNLTSEGQTWHQLAEMKYAVVVNMENVGNPDTSIFGMNTHMEADPTPHLTREMQVFAMCGIKWIRAWWGWGMCQKPAPPPDVYAWTEYDRQYNSVTNGTGIRIMPILLRYYAQYEQSWAGSVAGGTIQQPPLPTMMGEWGNFCGAVAQHYAGNIKAYELWNEPGYDDAGTVTTAVYTTLLNQTRPNIVKTGNDPNAKVIGFAGCRYVTNSGSPYVDVQDVLANGTAGDMDAVSEHTYAWIMLPEKNYAPGVAALRSVMTSGGCPTSMPIWDSEQGINADGDGYEVNWMSETDVAQYYARDVITAASQGSQRFFWFTADNPPTDGFAVTFGDSYTPRPRLAALNACASFLEGLTYQHSYIPSGKNSYAHVFKGANTGACAIWNTVSGMTVTLSMDASKVQAFDTMGNAIPVTGGSTSATIQIPLQRPTFLQCAIADYSTFDAALLTMRITAVSPVTITASPVVGGIQVILTGASSAPVDGIVSLVPAASRTPSGWPSPQRFQGLALGQSVTLRFSLPNKAGVEQISLVCGDRQLATFTVPYIGH